MTGTPSLPSTKKAATGEARNLSKALKERRIHLDHQVCLDLVARTRGHASAHAMLAALESAAPGTGKGKAKGGAQPTLRVPHKTRDDGTELSADLPLSAVFGIIQECVALAEARRAGTHDDREACFEELLESLETYGLLPAAEDEGSLRAVLAAGGDLGVFAAPSRGCIVDPLGLVALLTGTARVDWERSGGPKLSAEGQEFWYSEVADCGPTCEDVADLIRQGRSHGPRWSLKTEIDLTEDDAAREHIAGLVGEGYVEGYHPRWTVSIDNREPRTAYVEIDDGDVIVESGDDAGSLRRLLTAEAAAMAKDPRYSACVHVPAATATPAAREDAVEDLGDPSEGPVWQVRVRGYYAGDEDPTHKLLVKVRAHNSEEAKEKAEQKTEADVEYEGYDEIIATNASLCDGGDEPAPVTPPSIATVETTAYAYELSVCIVADEDIGHIAASAIRDAIEMAADAMLDDGDAVEVELVSSREITVRFGSSEEVRDNEAMRVVETLRDAVRGSLNADAGETLTFGDLLMVRHPGAAAS